MLALKLLLLVILIVIKITNELTDGSNLINGTYSWNKEESPSDSSAKSIFDFSKIILGLSLLLGIIL